MPGYDGCSKYVRSYYNYCFNDCFTLLGLVTMCAYSENRFKLPTASESNRCSSAVVERMPEEVMGSKHAGR